MKKTLRFFLLALTIGALLASPSHRKTITLDVDPPTTGCQKWCWVACWSIYGLDENCYLSCYDYICLGKLRSKPRPKVARVDVQTPTIQALLEARFAAILEPLR